MQVGLACPHCAAKIQDDPAKAGLVVACPYCGHTFEMPQLTYASADFSADVPIITTRSRSASSTQTAIRSAPQSAWGSVSFIIAFVSCGWLFLAVARAVFDLGGDGDVRFATIAWFTGVHALSIATCLIGLALGIVALTSKDRRHELAIYGLVGNGAPFLILLGMWSFEAVEKQNQRLQATAQRKTVQESPTPQGARPAAAPLHANRPPAVPERTLPHRDEPLPPIPGANEFVRGNDMARGEVFAPRPPLQAPDLQNLPVDFDQIKLPSGNAIRYREVSFARDQLESLFRKVRVEKLYVEKDANEQLLAAIGVQRAHLHGPAAQLHFNGKLSTLAFHDNASRHGPARLWDEDGNQLLFVSYVKGHKHGLECLFRDGAPWFVQEWDKDKLIGEFVLLWTGGGDRPMPLPAACGNLNLATAVEAFAARLSLSDLERTMDEGERDVKQGIVEWYHDTTQRERRIRAAETSVAGRRGSLDRISSVSSANDAAFQGMWQTALRRSGL